MRRIFKALAVFVALLTMSVTAIVLAQGSYPDPGSAVTNIVVQNKATGAGEEANVVAEYYDTDGNKDYTHDGITIQPKAVQEIKTEDEPLGDGWQGSAILSSDRDLAAIVSMKNEGVPGDSDGKTQGAYNGSSQGSTELYFPSVFRFEYIVSRVSVQNTQDSEATVYLNFNERDGSDAGRLEATIPAYSQRTFYLGDSDDVPSDFPSDFVDGSVYVTSTNELVGAAVSTWGNRSVAYQALTSANKGTTLYAPSHYRFIYDAPSDWDELPGSDWTLYSALNLQNTSATATANVTATYTARGDSSPSLTKTLTIEPLSASGLNTQNGGDFPASDFEDLSKAGDGTPDWDGSVEITSDQPLVGINITNWGAQGNAGSYALVAPSEGGSTLYLPAQYRLHYSDTSGWSQWSAINLMNVGTSTVNASDLTIEYIDQDGNSIKTFSGSDLPGDLAPGAAIGLNTRNGGDLDASDFDDFPEDGSRPNFIGGIYVSGPDASQLVAVGNIVYSDRASVYNGIPE